MDNENKNLAEELFNTLKDRAAYHAYVVNSCARVSDVCRNHVNYGVVTEDLYILRAMGHETFCAVWSDNGCLIIERITIDGKNAYKREFDI